MLSEGLESWFAGFGKKLSFTEKFESFKIKSLKACIKITEQENFVGGPQKLLKKFLWKNFVKNNK